LASHVEVRGTPAEPVAYDYSRFTNAPEALIRMAAEKGWGTNGGTADPSGQA
jgi:hypothetical protein